MHQCTGPVRCILVDMIWVYQSEQPRQLFRRVMNLICFQLLILILCQDLLQQTKKQCVTDLHAKNAKSAKQYEGARSMGLRPDCSMWAMMMRKCLFVFVLNCEVDLS